MDVIQQALAHLADAIQEHTAVSRELVAETKALRNDMRAHGDRCERHHGRTHDAITDMRLDAARTESGRVLKADADDWSGDTPSVVVKLGGRWTLGRIMGGLAKAWPLFLAGAGYGARWIVERLN